MIDRVADRRRRAGRRCRAGGVGVLQLAHVALALAALGDLLAAGNEPSVSCTYGGWVVTRCAKTYFGPGSGTSSSTLSAYRLLLAHRRPVPWVVRRDVRIAQRPERRGLQQRVRELVLSLVAEPAIGVDVRRVGRPPVPDVDVRVPELLEGGRHDDGAAAACAGWPAVRAVGRLGRQELAVEVLHVQRADQRERRLDVVRVSLASHRRSPAPRARSGRASLSKSYVSASAVSPAYRSTMM